MTTALMMELLALSNQPLSAVLAALPKYYQAKLKFECPVEKRAKVIKDVTSEADGRIETSDGLKVSDGKTWVLLRPSGTEPILRLFRESVSKEKLDSMMQKYKGTVQVSIKSWRQERDSTREMSGCTDGNMSAGVLPRGR